MDEKMQQALGRVLKKLSAVRQTMRNEDAQVLDLLIFGEEEVALHSAKDQVQSRIVGGARPRLAGRAAAQAPGKNIEAASEVAMHGLDASTGKAALGPEGRASAGAATPKNVDAASEVAMHGMDASTGKAVLGPEGRASAGAATPKNVDAASEVAMHGMDASTGKAALGPEGRASAGAATPKNVDAASEVAMHSMDASAGNIVSRIILDEDGNYVAVDAAAD